MKGKANVEMNEDLTFDPRIGFTINFPSYFYHGDFMCSGSLNLTMENMTFVLLFQGLFDCRIKLKRECIEVPA